MFSRARAVVPPLLILLLAAACGDTSTTGARRIAVVQFDNLSGDAGHGWVGPALASIVTERFRGAADTHVAGYPSARQAAVGRSTHLLQGHFDVRGGRCVLSLSMEDLAGGGMVSHGEFAAELPDGVLSLAAEAAGLIGDPVREFGSRDVEAIRSYGAALDQPYADDRIELLRDALDHDPGFPEAALALARILAGAGRKEEAAESLEKAAAAWAGDAFAEAQSAVILSALDGTPESMAEAQAGYAQLVPADSDAAEAAGEALLQAGRYGEAAKWYREALRAEPGRTELWNRAAYPLAYAGDFEGAAAALESYREAQPENANTYDSLGEIHFRFGRFEAAEQYFLQSAQTDPGFQGAAALVKAARCRLFLGDVAGADELFEEYAAGRRDLNDPAIEVRHAQWRYWTGRRREAVEALRAVADTEDAPVLIRTLARGQLAFWNILDGDLEAAGRDASEAARGLPGSVVDRVTLICQLLVRHSESQDAWRQVEPRDAARKEALIYAHLLAGRFAEAMPMLEETVAAAVPFGEDSWNILLAWAALETGGRERAAGLLATNPIIQPGSEDAFHSLVFPRLLSLQARVEGDAARAGELERMYERYGGGGGGG